MSETDIDPLKLIQPRRKVHGTTAVLLPFTEGGQIDWPAFDGLLDRTVAAGLTPAVNMDTGYVNLLDEATQDQVLARTRQRLEGRRFVAGAFVRDEPGAPFDLDAYARRIDAIQSAGGVPVIFQSYGLAHQADDTILANYQAIAERSDEFIGFELGTMFAPFGKIYSLDTYRGLMAIPRCSGAKHSSLRRDLEWRRIALRNETRPDFRVYTGNDLAIDMVIYGSDYLLGLSCFAPDAFARRDAMWEAGDPGWNELNDLLQHLGFLAFRDPVPAYKHAAAMFLKARGWLDCSATHPDSPRRGAADQELLDQIAATLRERLASS
ncbi:dihydrodipicolinate synthase family protein [Botrimarina sp.]|uniref:dihydrodipicolinate synthase family protein n=1 Tax=Botrimarina sp. TaxID=2795802 RepID=UPI0032F00596